MSARRNLITDIDGILVGNAHDARAASGVTVVLPPPRTVAGVSVLGGAPGTRETDALEPHNLVSGADGIVLSGGSVFGLAAADAVTAWLAARGRGYVLANSPLVAPVVPSAILFDLTNGGEKAWGAEPPYRALATRACDAAGAAFALGNIGAGYGARAGAYKGGLGSASALDDEGFTIAALIAANPFGSPVIPGTQTLWAWTLEQNGELGHQRAPVLPPGGIPSGMPADIKRPLNAGQNTTIGVVATDAALTPGEAKRLALMAQSGLSRAVRPIHTPVDGDVIFALATGTKEITGSRPAALTRLGSLAADCAARALARGVFEAQALNGVPAYRDICAAGFGS